MEGSSGDGLRKGGLRKWMKNIYVWKYNEWKNNRMGICSAFHISLYEAHIKVRGEGSYLICLVMPFSVKWFPV